MIGVECPGQISQRRFYINSLGSILHRLVIINETRLLLRIHGLEKRYLIFLEKAKVMECAMLNGAIFPVRFNKITEIRSLSPFRIRHSFNKHKSLLSILHYNIIVA